MNSRIIFVNKMPTVTTENTSAYLWWLIHKQKLSGAQIFEWAKEVQDWLVQNVAGKHRLGYWQNNFKWVEGDVTEIDGFFFSNAIIFSYEDDLLAFRLRFGIYS